MLPAYHSSPAFHCSDISFLHSARVCTRAAVRAEPLRSSGPCPASGSANRRPRPAAYLSRRPGQATCRADWVRPGSGPAPLQSRRVASTGPARVGYFSRRRRRVNPDPHRDVTRLAFRGAASAGGRPRRHLSPEPRAVRGPWTAASPPEWCRG